MFQAKCFMEGGLQRRGQSDSASQASNSGSDTAEVAVKIILTELTKLHKKPKHKRFAGNSGTSTTASKTALHLGTRKEHGLTAMPIGASDGGDDVLALSEESLSFSVWVSSSSTCGWDIIRCMYMWKYCVFTRFAQTSLAKTTTSAGLMRAIERGLHVGSLRMLQSEPNRLHE
eukprot:4974403-Amphidinium_carterae.1